MHHPVGSDRRDRYECYRITMRLFPPAASDCCCRQPGTAGRALGRATQPRSGNPPALPKCLWAMPRPHVSQSFVSLLVADHICIDLRNSC